MLQINVDLQKEYGLEFSCRMVGFIHEPNSEMPNNRRDAMVVVPGGGFNSVSAREGEVVAIDFYNRDYNTFTLDYSVKPVRFPNQLIQLAACVDYIKTNCDKCGVISSRVFAVGFSAGGHLVASLANATSIPYAKKNLDYTLTGVVLGYAVISHKTGYTGTHENLLGENYSPELQDAYKWLDLDTSVTKFNPPAFIWATANDGLVPSLNSILYAKAYAEKNIPYELHIFRSGNHGLSVADGRVNQLESIKDIPEVKQWLPLADNFLKRI